MAYDKSKHLAKKTQSDKVLKDKAFKIASDPKYELASIVYKFFEKKSSGSGIVNEPIYQLANKLHKPIIQKFKKRKVHSSFRDNIWGVDLADMQLLSKFNKGNKYLLCAIELFSKYASVNPIKDKKGVSIVNGSQKIISEGRETNKIWVDQSSEFDNNSFKDFLKINNIEMYSTYNEGKSVVTERFIRTPKNKILKHMTAIANVYFDVYNNTVHRTIKMKPIDVTSDFYAEYNEDFNKKDRIFKVGDHVRISKYKNIFAKGYAPNWSEEAFVVSKIKNTVRWTYVVSDLNGEEISGSFCENELQKLVKENLEYKKYLKKKGDKVYVKWKGYDNRFNSWIDKKDLI